MIRRILKLGGWVVDFLFAVGECDDEYILDCLYDVEAPYSVLQKVSRFLDSDCVNCGFTYGNTDIKQAVVFVGPSTSNEEFLDTLVHEIHHLAVIVASSIGYDLDSEAPAYVAGDYARDLAEVICMLGCPQCDKHLAN